MQSFLNIEKNGSHKTMQARECCRIINLCNDGTLELEIQSGDFPMLERLYLGNLKMLETMVIDHIVCGIKE